MLGASTLLPWSRLQHAGLQGRQMGVRKQQAAARGAAQAVARPHRRYLWTNGSARQSLAVARRDESFASILPSTSLDSSGAVELGSGLGSLCPQAAQG